MFSHVLKNLFKAVQNFSAGLSTPFLEPHRFKELLNLTYMFFIILKKSFLLLWHYVYSETTGAHPSVTPVTFLLHQSCGITGLWISFFVYLFVCFY